MKIGTLSIGPDTPCAVIAELSNNHNGKLENAKRLIRQAVEAGASAVKLQCYTPDELLALRGEQAVPEQWAAQGYTMRTLYEKAMTPREWFPALYAHAAELGIPLFSSVFGLDSLALLESLGNPCYKLAALDCKARRLERLVAATGKPMMVSLPPGEKYLGHAGIRESEERLTLACPSGYPQHPLRIERRWFDPLKGAFDGFSYHGTSIEPCVIAATLGAKILEVHVQLRDCPSELEANISLTMAQLAELVRRVRDVETVVA